MVSVNLFVDGLTFECIAGLQIFIMIGGPKRHMEQKLVGHYLK